MSGSLEQATEASQKTSVYIKKTPGQRTCVYSGRNRAEANRVANFWDKRVDTYIVEPPEGALAVALFKLDWLIAKLAPRKELKFLKRSRP